MPASCPQYQRHREICMSNRAIFCAYVTSSVAVTASDQGIDDTGPLGQSVVSALHLPFACAGEPEPWDDHDILTR